VLAESMRLEMLGTPRKCKPIQPHFFSMQLSSCHRRLSPLQTLKLVRDGQGGGVAGAEHPQLDSRTCRVPVRPIAGRRP
jgi:hypothetical protein